MLKKRFMCFAAAVLSVSLLTGMTAMASEEKENEHAFSIEVSEESDAAWEKIAMTNDDMVHTGLNIRDIPSSDGYVIACIYRGGAVKVVHKDEHWTEVEVGDVTGFIKNEYLTYGTEAKGLAEHYGVYGVEASWNDVHIFAEPDANAQIIYTAEAGEAFELLENQGHWQKIKFEDGEAYMSIEDVFSVILVDDMVIVEEPYKTSEDTYEEDGYQEEDYSDEDYSSDSSASSGNNSWSDSSNSGSSNTGSSGSSSWTGGSSSNSGSSSSGSSNSGSSNTGSSGSSSSGNTSSGSDSSSSTPSTEAPDTSGDDYYVDEDTSSDDIYTDDSTGTGDDYYEDLDGEYVEEIEDSASAEESYTEDYTEDASDYTEEAADSSASYSSSDLDLMASIIYCEAGNQSYEGMVAVGAVVMNRVNSSSFPNTISEVIYQSGQFTPASSGTLASALANGVPSTCYDAAAAAMAGENPVGSALYFNAGSGSGMQIGDHQFY